MENFYPLRQKPQKQSFKKGDILVLFGELFNRGYANGLVEEAQACGVTIVRATVGRRDENQNLRALTPEEIQNIPTPFINVPLEAGFDLEKDSSGQTPNDYLKSVKLSDWKSANVPEKTLFECRDLGRKRFRQQTSQFCQALEKIIQQNASANCHVHFAHLMAGGVPRAKIVLPLMNRVFKGVGDRYLASKEFWMSPIGKYLEMNFHEVTAETFNILIDETSNLRQNHIKGGGTVSYVAYGYHGTEILIGSNYRWQSYAPYLQGWAKNNLENYSRDWFKKGVQCCVYNCPEILTNSSSIFQGVEIPLYNLIRSLQKEKPHHPLTQKVISDCSQILKNPDDINVIFKKVDDFIAYSEKVGTSRYENWPQHSQQEQLETTLKLSDEVIAMHKDEKNLMTGFLSEVIFKSCGYIMLHDGYKPQSPVAWIGHDVVSHCIE